LQSAALADLTATTTTQQGSTALSTFIVANKMFLFK